MRRTTLVILVAALAFALAAGGATSAAAGPAPAAHAAAKRDRARKRAARCRRHKASKHRKASKRRKAASARRRAAGCRARRKGGRRGKARRRRKGRERRHGRSAPTDGLAKGVYVDAGRHLTFTVTGRHDIIGTGVQLAVPTPQSCQGAGILVGGTGVLLSSGTRAVGSIVGSLVDVSWSVTLRKGLQYAVTIDGDITVPDVPSCPWHDRWSGKLVKQ